MSGSPHYTGLLQIGNTWSAAILAKHLVIGLMVLAAAAQTWLLQPELERALLRPEPTGASQHSAQRYRQLTSVNLVLGLVVLALTAVARTA
jgi:putative copper export protein